MGQILNEEERENSEHELVNRGGVKKNKRAPRDKASIVQRGE